MIFYVIVARHVWFWTLVGNCLLKSELCKRIAIALSWQYQGDSRYICVSGGELPELKKSLPSQRADIGCGNKMAGNCRSCFALCDGRHAQQEFWGAMDEDVKSKKLTDMWRAGKRFQDLGRCRDKIWMILDHVRILWRKYRLPGSQPGTYSWRGAEATPPCRNRNVVSQARWDFEACLRCIWFHEVRCWCASYSCTSARGHCFTIFTLVAANVLGNFTLNPDSVEEESISATVSARVTMAWCCFRYLISVFFDGSRGLGCTVQGSLTPRLMS